MEPQAEPRKQNSRTLSLYVKCGAILILFLISVLIVACGGSAGATQTPLSTPAVTVTIHLGDNSNGKLPTMPGYTCGAWTTNTSPPYNNNVPIAIYAKYVQNVGGNPQGVAGAVATATFYWGDGSTDTATANTGNDGLAFFSMPATNKGAAVGKISLVTVSFAKDGTPGCTVDKDRAAYFSLVASTATPSPTATKQSKRPPFIPGPGTPWTFPSATPPTIGTGLPPVATP